MSRTHALLSLAARSPPARTLDCRCVSGLCGSRRGQYVRIRQDMRNTSHPKKLQKHENPRRSAGLGKRAIQDCASQLKIHPPSWRRQVRRSCSRRPHLQWESEWECERDAQIPPESSPKRTRPIRPNQVRTRMPKSLPNIEHVGAVYDCPNQVRTRTFIIPTTYENSEWDRAQTPNPHL